MLLEEKAMSTPSALTSCGEENIIIICGWLGETVAKVVLDPGNASLPGTDCWQYPDPGGEPGRACWIHLPGAEEGNNSSPVRAVDAAHCRHGRQGFHETRLPHDRTPFSCYMNKVFLSL